MRWDGMEVPKVVPARAGLGSRGGEGRSLLGTDEDVEDHGRTKGVPGVACVAVPKVEDGGGDGGVEDLGGEEARGARWNQRMPS
jgi:hypothetical protein